MSRKGVIKRREDIFLDDVDRQDFLKTLAEAAQKTGWQIHAYCLMGNHFHLVVETPEANLVEGMKWLLSTYTIRLNHRHRLFGHIFSGRYKALLVDGSGSGYLKTVCDYVHFNPVRARLVPPEERLLSYPWSSLGWYLAAKAHRPGWIRVDRLLGEHGIGEDTAEGRREFERRMEQRRSEEENQASLAPLRRGWYIGSDDFKNRMLAMMEGRLGPGHAGELRQASAEAKAELILTEELGRLGWTEQELAERRKNDPEKLVIGARLRRETTLTLGRIARRLSLGTSKSANANLHRWMRPQAAGAAAAVQTPKGKRPEKP